MSRKIGKIVLLTLIVSALGVLVLPGAVTLFEGEHIWYSNEKLDCTKCHADIADEFLSDANFHSGGLSGNIDEKTGEDKHIAAEVGLTDCRKCHKDYSGATASGNFKSVPEACYMCHKVPTGHGEYEYYPGEPNKEKGKHAATIIDCEHCHLVGWEGYWKNDPHYEFVMAAKADPTLPNATEACVACHTHAKVSINFTFAKYLAFNASVKKDTREPSNENVGKDLWEVGDWNAYGEVTHWIKGGERVD